MYFNHIINKCLKCMLLIGDKLVCKFYTNIGYKLYYKFFFFEKLLQTFNVAWFTSTPKKLNVHVKFIKSIEKLIRMS